MEEEKLKNPPEGRRNTGKRSGTVRRVLKSLLIVFIGLWAVMFIALQVVLNSRVLSGIVGRLAEEYVDGSVTFGRINASMFRSFPYLNIGIEDFSVTYPHDRFSAYDSRGLSRLDNAGRCTASDTASVQSDTLAHFSRLSVSLNYVAALLGKIDVRHAILEQPRIFAHQYRDSVANWNIFRTGSGESQEDSTSASASVSIPPVVLHKVSLTGRPFVVYTNPSDTVYGSLYMKNLEARGRYRAAADELGDISLNIDSLFLTGRLPADTVALGLDYLKVNEKGKLFDIDLRSRLLLALRSVNRMDIPLSVRAKVVPELSAKSVNLKELTAEIATVGITANGIVDYSADSLYVDASVLIDKASLNDLSDFFSGNFPMLKELSTDAVLSLNASCKGYLGGTSVPDVEVQATVPQSRIGWKSLGEEGYIALDASAGTGSDAIWASVSEMCLKIDGLDIDLSGNCRDITAADPKLILDTRVHAVLDSLVRFIPDSLGIWASGNLEGDIAGSLRLSHLSPYNFSSCGLEGSIRSDGISLSMPSDTLFAYLGGTSIGFAPSGTEDTKTAASVSVDSLFAKYGASTFIRGTAFSLTACNSSDTIGGDMNRHPLTGTLSVGSAGMMDAGYCFVGTRGLSGSFKYDLDVSSETETPNVSLDLLSKGIAVREGVNRVTLNDMGFSVSARSGKADKLARRRHVQDSLARVYPGVPRDSLFRRAFSGLRRGALPDFLSEKDFEKKDISINLGETVSEYVRDWEVSGSLDIGGGKVITPYYPLDNRISDVSGNFTNNSVTLSNLTVNSGSSDISASGTLSGFRRILEGGKGRIKLDLDITSDVIDADEILLALNSGSSFTPPDARIALEEVSDGEYLSTVTENSSADSLAVDPLIVLPANLEADVSLTAGAIRYSDFESSWLSSDLQMRNRCLQMVNTMAMTNMGDIFFEGFYSTKTKKDLKVGFDLTLSNITAEKVIHLMPAVDSIVPMLKTFRGLLDCEIAATASMDTLMNIQLPTLNGIIKIDGKNLSLAESEDINKLRKTLMFKDKDSTYIDQMSVRGIVKDDQLEVFPFILKMDRYTLGASGLQQFDQNFKYHISAIKSPLPFRLGINLNGTFASWKWKLGKAKYKSKDVPDFSEQVDALKFNLLEAIHNVFDRGVDHALQANARSQEAIEKRKNELDFNSGTQTDSLNVVEQKLLEVAQKEETEEETEEEVEIEVEEEELPAEEL